MQSLGVSSVQPSGQLARTAVLQWGRQVWLISFFRSNKSGNVQSTCCFLCVCFVSFLYWIYIQRMLTTLMKTSAFVKSPVRFLLIRLVHETKLAVSGDDWNTSRVWLKHVEKAAGLEDATGRQELRVELHLFVTTFCVSFFFSSFRIQQSCENNVKFRSFQVSNSPCFCCVMLCLFNLFLITYRKLITGSIKKAVGATSYDCAIITCWNWKTNDWHGSIWDSARQCQLTTSWGERVFCLVHFQYGFHKRNPWQFWLKHVETFQFL